MATTVLADVAELLKEVYEPRVRDQLQSEMIAARRIEKSSDGITSRVGGKFVRFAIRIKRNHGIGARGENSALPAARHQSYEDAEVEMAYLYGAIELSGQSFELAETDFQSFASTLDQEVDGLKQTLGKDMNRQTYGTNAGIVGTAASGTTTTFVLADADALYFEEGMILDFFDDSADALHGPGEFEVTEISSDGTDTTVTFTPASTSAIAVDDTAHRFGARNLETIGFEEIISDTGTLYAIDPTVTSVWKSVVNDNDGTNRALSEGLMTKMADDIRKKGGKTTVIFTSLGVRRAYFDLLAQQRRYNDPKEFAGGFKGLAFMTDNGDIPMISDFDCQPNRAYFVNEKELTLYRAGDWSWMNRDGSMWNRKVTASGTFDAYEATMYKYCQLGTHRRNSHGLLSDITEAE